MEFSSYFNRVLVTGGSGFIGGTLVRRLIRETNLMVFNLDKSAIECSLDIDRNFSDIDRYQFLNTDLSNYEDTLFAIKESNPDLVFHLAAESHVDRSISGPRAFIQSNILGTFNLLEALLPHWESLSPERKKIFRLVHVSTDEVFGSLGPDGLFSEDSPYDPSSPYSATKAASDHLVQSWYQTYGLPSIITNSTNNFGPWQLPEKLIPLIIINAIDNKPIPIYGDGKNIRDWIYVEDHVEALIKVALNGKLGDSYCIGGSQEKSNNEIVELICSLLDSQKQFNAPHNRLKCYVKDRLGHDYRYAVDTKKIREDLDWVPKYKFSHAMSSTVKWYLKNIDWCNKHLE